MKRLVSLGVAAFLGFLVLPTSPSWLYADSHNNAAAVIKGASCSLFDGDGGSVVVPGRIKVITSNGTRTLTCIAKNVPNSTGKAVLYRGFLCLISGVPTYNSHATVSASGNAQLTCRVAHPKD